MCCRILVLVQYNYSQPADTSRFYDVLSLLEDTSTRDSFRRGGVRTVASRGAHEWEPANELPEYEHAERRHDERQRHCDGPGVHDVAERGPRDVRARAHASDGHHAAHLCAQAPLASSRRGRIDEAELVIGPVYCT